MNIQFHSVQYSKWGLIYFSLMDGIVLDFGLIVVVLNKCTCFGNSSCMGWNNVFDLQGCFVENYVNSIWGIFSHYYYAMADV